jgi:Putative prokaryotic signal transducing protein
MGGESNHDRYAAAVDVVTLTVVHDETEADVLCGLLRANGIECSYRKSDMGAGATSGLGQAGPIEVLVKADDLAEAQKLLASR